MKQLGLTFAAFLCWFASALAQTAGTGALSGTVTDQSGAGVPDAKITVANEATGEVRSVMSQSNGSFVVPLLPPGAYRVEFTKTGFKVAVRTGLTINVTETMRLDVSLDVGTLQE